MRLLGMLRLAFGAMKNRKAQRLVRLGFELLAAIAEVTETDLDDRVIHFLRAMAVDDHVIDKVLDAGGAEP